MVTNNKKGKTMWPTIPNIMLVLLMTLSIFSKTSVATPISNITTQDFSISILDPEDDTQIPLNKLHSWKIKVILHEGDPNSEVMFKITGGMESHGHGLPTSPIVTATNNPGEYIVTGLKFQMRGEWFLSWKIKTPHKEYPVQKILFTVH